MGKNVFNIINIIKYYFPASHVMYHVYTYTYRICTMYSVTITWKRKKTTFDNVIWATKVNYHSSVRILILIIYWIKASTTVVFGTIGTVVNTCLCDKVFEHCEPGWSLVTHPGTRGSGYYLLSVTKRDW